jgi:hypothetical protein
MCLEYLGFGGEKHEDCTLDWLDERLAESQPVVVPLFFGFSQVGSRALMHAVVVMGADDAHVLYHDPVDGPRQTMSRRDFAAQWELTERRALLVFHP